jgi:ferredoxin
VRIERCEASAPEIYNVVEAGLVFLTEIGQRARPEHVTFAAKGVLSCPENAITVTGESVS